MYHYTDCGLSHIFLTNGYNVEEVDGEEYVSIDDVHGLHCVIAKSLVDQVRPLTPDELRFLRVELNTSQKSLGNLLGVDSQTVARWEKGQTAIPRTADVTVRVLYTESVDGDSQVGLLLNMLSDAEIKSTMGKLYFEEKDSKWEVAA